MGEQFCQVCRAASTAVTRLKFKIRRMMIILISTGRVAAPKVSYQAARAAWPAEVHEVPAVAAVPAPPLEAIVSCNFKFW